MLPCSFALYTQKRKKKAYLKNSNTCAFDRETEVSIKTAPWGFGPAFLGVFINSEEIYENPF